MHKIIVCLALAASFALPAVAQEPATLAVVLGQEFPRSQMEWESTSIIACHPEDATLTLMVERGTPGYPTYAMTTFEVARGDSFLVRDTQYVNGVRTHLIFLVIVKSVTSQICEAEFELTRLVQ